MGLNQSDLSFTECIIATVYLTNIWLTHWIASYSYLQWWPSQNELVEIHVIEDWETIFERSSQIQHLWSVHVC